MKNWYIGWIIVLSMMLGIDIEKDRTFGAVLDTVAVGSCIYFLKKEIKEEAGKKK